MRLLIALIVIATVGLLYSRFPYAMQSENASHNLFYMVAVLIMVAGGSAYLFKGRMTQAARDIGIWVCIFLVLVLGYSFRDRIQGELMPSQARVNDDGTLTLHAAQNGHFFVEAQINGVPVKLMVDTGASDIVLSPAEAERAGIEVNSLTYDHDFSTANGYGSGASVRLETLKVGSIRLRDVPVSVNKADMDHGLLGMSFLKRLRGFRVEGNTLVLIP